MKRTVLALGISAIVAFLVVAPNAHGQSPPPVPTIGAPPGGPPGPPGSNPTATATLVPTATPTATVVPLTLRLSLAHSKVSAGGTQKVTATTLAGASVSVSVTFPNGKKDSVQGSAGASGKLSYSFTQPSGMTRGSNHTVTVHASASALGQSKSATKKYTIG
jgi:hypothetical protein